MLRQSKYLQRKERAAKAGPQLVRAKSVKAQIPVRKSIVNEGKYAAAKRLPQGVHLTPQKAVKLEGGKLNPAGIPSFQSSKYGSSSEPGVFASGRRAKPTGFGSKAGSILTKVGTQQAVKKRNGIAFWHNYGKPVPKR